MFHEQIAKLTADHLRSHIGPYLATIQLEDPKQKLIIPKDISPASVVGGLMTEFDKILPQYGVDILSKVGGEDIANLFTYDYIGQLNGLVGSTSRESADKLCARHARAMEKFVRQHQFLHNETNTNYTILSFGFIGLEFSGAENLGTYEDREVWVAGFSLNSVWTTSEDGPEQHG